MAPTKGAPVVRLEPDGARRLDVATLPAVVLRPV
jgi:hypothetical protein